MEEILKLKNEDLEVEYEIIPVFNEEISDSRQAQVKESIKEIDLELDVVNRKIEELNSEIDKLTNHADGIDYIFSVFSGVAAGVIDSIWVGEFSIDRANEYGNKKVEEKVINKAEKKKKAEEKKKEKNNNKIEENKTSKERDQNDDANEKMTLDDAVAYFEKRFKIVADKSTSTFGGGNQHHLRDFSHHPTIVGLFFSMLTQFTKKVYGTDKTGKLLISPVKKEHMFLIGKNVHEKITFGAVNWFYHMISDMAGSK